MQKQKSLSRVLAEVSVIVATIKQDTPANIRYKKLRKAHEKLLKKINRMERTHDTTNQNEQHLFLQLISTEKHLKLRYLQAFQEMTSINNRKNRTI